jgi:C1A family cysteine protease
VSGSVAGGHEYVIAGFNPSNNLLRLVNSWGTGWGRNGHAYVDADAYRTLIDDGGDCTVPVPRA